MEAFQNFYDQQTIKKLSSIIFLTSSGLIALFSPKTVPLSVNLYIIFQLLKINFETIRSIQVRSVSSIKAEI